jgi:hypothetical protein
MPDYTIADINAVNDRILPRLNDNTKLELLDKVNQQIEDIIAKTTGTPLNTEALALKKKFEEIVSKFVYKNTGGGRRKTRRLMSKKYCKKTPCKKMGFTQKASCRPWKNCYRKSKK